METGSAGQDCLTNAVLVTAPACGLDKSERSRCRQQTVTRNVSAYRDNQNWHIQMAKLGTEKDQSWFAFMTMKRHDMLPKLREAWCHYLIGFEPNNKKIFLIGKMLKRQFPLKTWASVCMPGYGRKLMSA